MLCCLHIHAQALDQNPWTIQQYPEYRGAPWVRNLSRPYPVSQGLEGRHLAIWASHGRYYNQSEGKWKWQRPLLFGTTEDLFTQTIVVPYLIPMLERAGAIVFTPRERDWQLNEVIVDNDQHGSGYKEEHGSWKNTDKPGFMMHSGNYYDKENPFVAGTARRIKASKKGKGAVSWQPTIPEDGRYAVYVSYQTVSKSVPDAHYIVFHKGGETHFLVNQQMGGGTWVYLGTFDFDKGSSPANRVVLTNETGVRKGIVTADAVRFGGGMGNISRGGTVSGYPRYDEGSRYYAQWAGMPYSVYSSKDGSDDYSDDINVRSLMVNHTSGGSIFNPAQSDGLGVPLELTLALHSDAGKSSGVVGSLAICTTSHNDQMLGSGQSRQVSYTLAQDLLNNVTTDMTALLGRWNKRYLWDRNYSETRLPEVPSAILEMLSHENFTDMRYGHDPEFKFWLARSIYKTLLRYMAKLHNTTAVVQPLTPSCFGCDLQEGRLQLSWQPTADSHEPTSTPAAYVLYTAKGNGAFDNGQVVRSNSCVLNLEPGTLYRFRVSAINDGGESFPSEVLCARYTSNEAPTILVVNGFHRLASPAITGSSFNLDADAGLSLGPTPAWNAHHLLAGNTQDYVVPHAEAIALSGNYNIVSCQSQALESSSISTHGKAMIDVILGNERNDGYSLLRGKTFSPSMRNILSQYVDGGGHLLVSGSHINSDMAAQEERQWLQSTLHVGAPLKAELSTDSIMMYSELPPSEWATSANDTLIGMSQTITIWNKPNAQHYAAQHTDMLQAIGGAFPILTYKDSTVAAVAYDPTEEARGRGRTISMGVPLECIRLTDIRNVTMKAFIGFLLKEEE